MKTSLAISFIPANVQYEWLQKRSSVDAGPPNRQRTCRELTALPSFPRSFASPARSYRFGHAPLLVRLGKSDRLASRTCLLAAPSATVDVMIRNFGIRTPPCTAERPSYGIIGYLHILPPALAWLWRLVSPRGYANPSVTETAGMTSEGVGSYWPFASGRIVDHANLLAGEEYGGRRPLLADESDSPHETSSWGSLRTYAKRDC
jgi:hypothetical protein